jgi:hypothetical protein
VTTIVVLPCTTYARDRRLGSLQGFLETRENQFALVPLTGFASRSQYPGRYNNMCPSACVLTCVRANEEDEGEVSVKGTARARTRSCNNEN